MIGFQEAIEKLMKYTPVMNPGFSSLTDASGLTLADSIFSQHDHPQFEQAAMDGYAFRFEDLKNGKPIMIRGEAAAGSHEKIFLGSQQAIRIFTGAPVPEGADTVVMQEKVKEDGGQLYILDDTIQSGTNVRPAGSEIRKGDCALEASTLLTPAAIGFLAGLGNTGLPVISRPRISILVTGNELQRPGMPLEFGQVYESNASMLTAALNSLPVTISEPVWIKDERPALEEAIRNALVSSDLILITGGVSVGDHDHTTASLSACGIETIFHKVRQKPGKPLFFGRKDDCVVFGLPGNPSSVLTCFYLYVLPSIRKMLGRQKTALETIFLPMTTAFQKKPGLTHFLKGQYGDGEVRLLGAQESYRLSSFALANCLVELDEESTGVEKGQPVKLHLLP
jgi:molybdopterin molybdotransferase